MIKGQYVKLLVNYRYHDAGHIGKIDRILSDEVASVDLKWYSESSTHHIYIRTEDEGELWELVEV